MPQQVPIPPADPGTTQGSETLYGAVVNNGGNQQTNSTGTTQGQFTAGQQALQGLVPGLYSQYLSGGGVPSYFTAPQQVFDAYNAQFNKFVKPGLAAQYGGGSPQIGAQQAYGNQQLAANLYQTGVGQYQNALAGAGGYSLAPVGQAQTNQGNNVFEQDTQTAGIQSQQLGQSIVALIMQLFGLV